MWLCGGSHKAIRLYLSTAKYTDQLDNQTILTYVSTVITNVPMHGCAQ